MVYKTIDKSRNTVYNNIYNHRSDNAMELNEIYKFILSDKYYTIEDFRYNKKIGFLLSKDELSQLFSEKERLIEEDNEYFIKLPLKTFNSKFCYYVEGKYIVYNFAQYANYIISDYEEHHCSIFERHLDDIYLSRIFSEVEGTLNVENVPTTHKRVKEIYQKKDITDKNDVIVKNMLDAMEFIIKQKPDFNKENLFKLYCILSHDCLDDEDKLKDGEYYRDDDIIIEGYEGANPAIIDECMDSLFEFVNDPDNVKKYWALLPHICHYYILYVHPYFDYNGRTARMVSFWLNHIFEIGAGPIFMSEAINDNKGEYYTAIRNTRNTGNDLTYFLGYILETAIKYSLLYKNIENITHALAHTGDFLNSTELGYLKKIIVHNQDTYFNYKEFLKYIHGTMSKTAALKILNNLAEYNILEKTINKKKEAIFKLNQDMIIFKYTD